MRSVKSKNSDSSNHNCIELRQSKMLRIDHVATYELLGGAARASNQINSCLTRHGKIHEISSSLLVLNRESLDASVTTLTPRLRHKITLPIQSSINSRRLHRFKTSNSTYHSTGLEYTGASRSLNERNSDIVNLHWINGILSIKDISEIDKPIVWSLHDQWAFCGAEHYAGDNGSSSPRYAAGYTKQNCPSDEQEYDLNRKVWHSKKKLWSKKSFNLVCASSWMKDCVRRSELMGSYPIHTIPYPIDTDVMVDRDQATCKKLLSIPHDRKCILIVTTSIRDDRKGGMLLISALNRIWQQSFHNNSMLPALVLLGDKSNLSNLDIQFPYYQFGGVRDDISLSIFYSAADLLALPSTQDNMPLVGMEAHACGTPVVGFKIGGIPDIVSDFKTGRLAKPFDTHDYANCIQWCLEDAQRLKELGANSRMKCTNHWSPRVVAAQYSDLYHEIYSYPKH